MKNNFRNVRVFEKIFKEFLPAGFAEVCRQSGRDGEGNVSDAAEKNKTAKRERQINVMQ